MNSRVAVLSLIFTLLLLAGVVGHILPVQSQIFPGDILVIDPTAGTGFKGALFRVDPFTGARTLFSDFGVGANQGVSPTGVAVETSGTILVIDRSAGTNNKGALFRIDPSTGDHTLLSNFGVGANQGVDPRGVAVEASGSILVTDSGAGTGFQGALFRVNPITGDRILLSDFGVGANQGAGPSGVAVEASGTILVTDADAGTNNKGDLFRVDPFTGARTLLSNFGDGDPKGEDPRGVAVEASGTILVIDPAAGTGGDGALFRVDPTTGARTLLSNFGVGANQGEDTFGVAVYPVIPAPVGGVVPPVNKLEILAPYLALAGLVAAVTVAFTIKKRRRE